MEYNLKEFIISFLEERIIVLEQKESIDRMSIEGATESVEQMIELCDINDNSKAVVFHIRSLYIKKDVMRVFSSHPTHKKVTCTGLVSPSFLAKNIASMLLKMRARFMEDDIPVKIFSTEKEAIEWVGSILGAES